MRQAARAIVVKDDQLLVMYRDKFGQEYYTLVGGGLDVGESAEQALIRELREESGIEVAHPRLVIVEDAGEMYGVQHIFWCDYVSGEPHLAFDSEEAKINALGNNIHEPMWLPIAKLNETPFRSDKLKQALMKALPHGFSPSDKPIQIDSRNKAHGEL